MQTGRLGLLRRRRGAAPPPCPPPPTTTTTTQLASLLEQYFFPKWHAVLRHWLSNNPNYDEVTRWWAHPAA